MERNSTAFSLVELSIVLVILGLLVGGVLSGQALIRAAELRAVSTEYSRWVAATQSFRDKYFALPGDITNAQSFWGIADPTPATCVTTTSVGTATCNGNGDGFVLLSTGSNEPFRFWQHLASAGLIEGVYTGVTDGTNATSFTTNNSPRSKLGNNAIWGPLYYSTFSGNASIFDGFYGNIFHFGGVFPNNNPQIAILKPEEAWNLDTKLDDGRPGQGKLVARDVSGFTGINCTTATASSQITAEYHLPQSAQRCALMFRTVF